MRPELARVVVTTFSVAMLLLHAADAQACWRVKRQVHHQDFGRDPIPPRLIFARLFQPGDVVKLKSGGPDPIPPRLVFARLFQPGDVVKLKSGGPEMTVVEYDPKFGNIRCQWYLDGGYNSGYFEESVLVKVR